MWPRPLGGREIASWRRCVPLRATTPHPRPDWQPGSAGLRPTATCGIPACRRAHRVSEAGFLLLDKNKDGHLDLDELQSLTSVAPRLKQNPELVRLMFQALDTNADGQITPAEWKLAASIWTR